MHPKDDLLRAYFDKELAENQTQQVHQHLAHCTDCQTRLNEMAGRAGRVYSHMDALAPRALEGSRAPKVAYKRFTSNSRLMKEQKESIKNMFTRRPLWTALAVIAVLALVFTITPANAWASGLLGLFRVQKVQVVTFDPAAAENARTRLTANQAEIEQVFKEDMKITHQGTVTEVTSASEAKDKAGFAPRLPGTMKTPTLAVKPGMNVQFTINQPKLQAMIDAVGVDMQLPKEVNGKDITVDVPSAVVATSGCPVGKGSLEAESQAPADCTVLIQVPSPTVNTPAGLDVQKLGNTMFQFLGIPADQAQQLSQRIDWTSTLVLPIPQGSKIQYQDVQVDGVTATFLQEEGQNSYQMIWVKDGVLYGLHGPGGLQDALKIAGSLQ